MLSVYELPRHPKSSNENSIGCTGCFASRTIFVAHQITVNRDINNVDVMALLMLAWFVHFLLRN
jgi:hypothetical protein